MKMESIGPFMVKTPTELQTQWSRLRAIILKTLPLMGGTHSEADLIADCLAGRMTFWAAPKSFSLSCIEVFPQLTRAHWIIAGGDTGEADRIGAMILAWGKERGATQFLCSVRPGIARHNERKPGERLSKGWKSTRITYVMEI